MTMKQNINLCIESTFNHVFIFAHQDDEIFALPLIHFLNSCRHKIIIIHLTGNKDRDNESRVAMKLLFGDLITILPLSALDIKDGDLLNNLFLTYQCLENILFHKFSNLIFILMHLKLDIQIMMLVMP